MLKALQNTDKGNSCQKKVITKMNVRFTGVRDQKILSSLFVFQPHFLRK